MGRLGELEQQYKDDTGRPTVGRCECSHYYATRDFVEWLVRRIPKNLNSKGECRYIWKITDVKGGPDTRITVCAKNKDDAYYKVRALLHDKAHAIELIGVLPLVC